jgi:hypothetical protein
MPEFMTPAEPQRKLLVIRDIKSAPPRRSAEQ